MKPKPKLVHANRGKLARGKVVQKDVHPSSALTIGHQFTNARPSVEISKCISFQKFRYSGENRPGKKYQEKEFMELRLKNLNDRVVRIVIICTDAENKELIHPNGLVGKDCHDGIYDKELAINSDTEEIKIPYLRTERIKTKKHECDNIQTILEERARHLPSPYKERCLSQCNDKYTSARKFDTTKVCLGVIVTIVSHQGSFNGSLHAISHVVRNASEKTILGIYKLSQPFISASEGGLVDIFTTEFGPEIEDGKYFVYVTFKDDKLYGQWRSETFTAVKANILYKRIISYRIPPFELCPDLASPVQAMLNLECPQSNQYCSYEFTYRPHYDMLSPEDQIHSQRKRSLSSQEDVKPSPKQLKIDEETYDIEQSTGIKEKLQNKLRAKHDNCYGIRKDESKGDVAVHQPRALPKGELPIYELPIYVDLDGHPRQNSNTVISSANSFIKSQGPSSSHGHQSIEVVATGYSDDVPPDTTVLIYTTATGGTCTDPFSETGHQDEQVILQEIPQRPNELSNEHIPSDQLIRYVKDSKNTSYHLLSAQENAQIVSSLRNTSRIQEVDSNRNEHNSKTIHRTVSNGTSSSASRQFVVSSSSPSQVTTSDNVICRMVVPNKDHQSSPWEVASDEDNLAAVLFPSKTHKVEVKENNRIKKSSEGMSQGGHDKSDSKDISDKARTNDIMPAPQTVQGNTSTSTTVQENTFSSTIDGKASKENPVLNFNFDSATFNEVQDLPTVDVFNISENMKNTFLPTIDTDLV